MQPRNGQNWYSSVGNYVHHNRKTAKIRFCTPLKSVIYFRFVSKQQASSRPHFRAVYKVLWKTVKNCVRNHSRSDVIDTETEMCTSLKYEFYFCWPPSTKSKLISYISIQVFMTIRGKICPPQSRNWKKWILHTSKIGNLLPVCLRYNRHLADHISSRTQSFNGKWWRIAYVISLDRMKSTAKPKFAPC